MAEWSPSQQLVCLSVEVGAVADSLNGDLCMDDMSGGTPVLVPQHRDIIYICTASFHPNRCICDTFRTLIQYT